MVSVNRDLLLEKHFDEVETAPSQPTIAMLAAATSLTATQVANWFEVRRRRVELRGGQRGYLLSLSLLGAQFEPVAAAAGTARWVRLIVGEDR